MRLLIFHASFIFVAFFLRFFGFFLSHTSRCVPCGSCGGYMIPYGGSWVVFFEDSVDLCAYVAGRFGVFSWHVDYLVYVPQKC